jgi:hypothetical protein
MRFENDPTDNHTRQRVNVSARILEAELRPIPYRRDGRRWRPDHISITWSRERTGSGEWSAWGSSGASVVGPQINKDGGDGQMTTSLRYVRASDPEWGEWVTASRPDVDTAGEA